MKVVKGEEIFVITDNKVGKLAEVCGLISGADINIRAICAYAVEEKAFFRLITSDNKKTKVVLAKNDYYLEDREAVIVEIPDKVGELHSLVSKLKEAQIDLNYIYGTASKPEAEAIIVFSSNDNDMALDVLAS